jgi:hypothetical protein
MRRNGVNGDCAQPRCLLPAFWAGRMGVRNAMARMNRKARLCPNMFGVRQFDPRKGIGRQDFIEVSGIQPYALARLVPRSADSPDLWRNWVKEGEIIEKGYIALPERAGLGVEMNEDAARKAQVPGTPWFEKA